MKIRHTVIFTFYESTTKDQRAEVDFLVEHLGVTDWIVAEHVPETFKAKRAHLLQDGVFPSLEALQKHGESPAHHYVAELTPLVSDWMTVDTFVKD